MISVIVPVYNRPELLEKAALSVLSQTFSDLELIIIDDCSTDSTPLVISRLAASDSRVKPLFLRKHRGNPGAVRNEGVRKAAGKYIAFLDSDDIWEPEKLELQLPLMERYRFVHTGEKWLRLGKEVSQKSMKFRREGDIFSDALEKCFIGPSTVMMEKKLFTEKGGFDPTLEICEDYEFWLRITSTENIGYLDRRLTVKQAGNWEQLSFKYGQIEIFRIRALEKLLKKGYFSGEQKLLAEEAFRTKCAVYSAGCRKRGKDKEAEKYENLPGTVARFSWYLYILECRDGSFYTGITTDPARREAEHNGSARGARYTRSRRPVKMVFCQEMPSRKKAMEAEAALKRKSAEDKKNIVKKGFYVLT